MADTSAAQTRGQLKRVDTILVDGTQAVGRNAQLDPAVFAGDPEATLVDVGVELATGGIIGVRDVVTALHAFAGDLTNTAHTYLDIGFFTHSLGEIGLAARTKIAASR